MRFDGLLLWFLGLLLVGRLLLNLRQLSIQLGFPLFGGLYFILLLLVLFLLFPLARLGIRSTAGEHFAGGFARAFPVFNTLNTNQVHYVISVSGYLESLFCLSGGHNTGISTSHHFTSNQLQ